MAFKTGDKTMMQIIEQTDEEKLAMYMKCKKVELAKMLIECNRIIALRPSTYMSTFDNTAHNYEPDLNSTSGNCRVCGQSKWNHRS